MEREFIITMARNNDWDCTALFSTTPNTNGAVAVVPMPTFNINNNFNNTSGDST